MDEFCEWGEVAFIEQPELVHEADEVLEGCVQMRRLIQLQHMRKVLVIDVRVDPEETAKDGANTRFKGARKGRAQSGREDTFIVQLLLDPTQQEVDVLGRRTGQRPTHVLPVRPTKLEPSTGTHHRAAGRRAELR